MQVDDVAAPASGIDGVEKIVKMVQAAIVGGGRAKAHASGHQVLPVGQYLVHRLGMVVDGVAGLVVGLHMRRIRHAAARTGRGPVFIDVVRHALAVGAAVLSQSERIAGGDVKLAHRVAAGVVGNARLAGVVPFEDAVGGDTAIEHVGQYGHLKVLGVGNEATAVATPLGTGGEGDHIATFEFETVYTVVELLRAEGVHEPTTVFQSEGIHGLALEM